jgi:ribose/xylose/arabinose/galactoside ABC-type transport system permease subunit
MRDVARDAWIGTRPFRPALAIVVILFVLFAAWQPGFRTGLNLQNILSSVAVLFIISMAQTLVLISGGLDLSVGAVVTICGIMLAKLVEANVMPGPLALIVTIVFGGVLGGVFNGILVGLFRLNVFIVTLASMTILSGIVLVWTKMESVYVSAPVIRALSIDRHFGIQAPILIMIVVFLTFLYLQRFTYFGRDVYATGGSYTAARLSGIRTERTLIAVYAIAGACAGLASVVSIGRLGAASPEVQPILALDAVAAVLIGGTLLTGGKGSVVGTVFGVLFIGILRNGLNMVGVASPWQMVITGIILVVAVMGSRGGAGLGGRGSLGSLAKRLQLRSRP